MAKTKHHSDDTIIIKKYANRRLYNTQSSSYITLDFLAKLIREGKDFKVIDAKSGDDITRAILTQIIMEEESGERQMLPVGFLRQLIAMYGNSMQSLLPGYLEASMDAFRNNNQRFQKAVEGTIANGPLAQLAQHQMAMLKAASDAFTPASGKTESSFSKTKNAEENPPDEVEELKAQLAAMQEKIDKLQSKD